MKLPRWAQLTRYCAVVTAFRTLPRAAPLWWPRFILLRRTVTEREWAWGSNGGMMVRTRILAPALPHIRHSPPLLLFTSLCPLCSGLCNIIPNHYHLAKGTWMSLKCHSSHLNSRSSRFQDFSLDPNVFSAWSPLMLLLWLPRMGQSCHDVLRCILHFFIATNTYLILQ